MLATIIAETEKVGGKIMNDEDGKRSNCCNAPMIAEQSMCSACKEYCVRNAAQAECDASMKEALAEYPAHRERQEREQEQEECPHDEHDHGICLSCSKDIFDDLVGRADFLKDE